MSWDRGWCTHCPLPLDKHHPRAQGDAACLEFRMAVDGAFKALGRFMRFAPVWLAFECGALAMQAECARRVRAYPDRRKADSTVWRIDSVLAEELAARIECIDPEDL